jgi:hypothetical protein
MRRGRGSLVAMQNPGDGCDLLRFNLSTDIFLLIFV